jgi:hypothetical protein
VVFSRNATPVGVTDCDPLPVAERDAG